MAEPNDIWNDIWAKKLLAEAPEKEDCCCSHTLEELLEKVTPENSHEAMDWGNPVGNEDWYEPRTMERLLDLLSDEIDSDPSKLIPYTVEMDAELGELLHGVELPDTLN